MGENSVFNNGIVNEKEPNKHIFTPREGPTPSREENFIPHSDMPWPLMSECVDRDPEISIMNQEKPNKHFTPKTRTFTFDDEKNDWIGDDYHNFWIMRPQDQVIYIFLQSLELLLYVFQLFDFLI